MTEAAKVAADGKWRMCDNGLVSRPLYALLIAGPLAVVADLLRFPAPVVFGLAALGVIPLAGLIGKATEELAVHVGPKFGGLLNATFGNAAELIITILAIRQGLLELVKASITGAIIGNSLLILGLSLLVGGIKFGRQTFDHDEAGHHVTLMILAAAGLFQPAMLANIVGPGFVVEEMSLLTAAVMLLTYFAYIGYSLFRDPASLTHGDGEALTGRAEQRAVAEAEHHVAEWSKRTAIVVLAAATGATVFVSELLVRTVEPVTLQLGWSEFFVGVIIVPLIGNAAEHFSAITFAAKNRLDVTMAIAAGSSTQIALFVGPLLVFVSLLLGHPMDLVFVPAELLILGLSTAIFAFVALDGRSNWLEGLQLLAVYTIAAFLFFFLPMTGAAGH